MKSDATKIVTPVRQAVTRAQVKVESAQGHAKIAATAIGELELQLPPQTPELHSLAQRVREEVVDLTKDLDVVSAELRTSQLKVDELELAAGKIITERDVALKEKGILERRYDKLKFGLCTLTAAGALYLLLQFKSVLAFAGPYAWIAFVAGPIAVFALFWKLIDWAL